MKFKQQNKRLLQAITAAKDRLTKKLSRLDFGSLKISEHNLRSLKRQMAGVSLILNLYGRLIYLSLKDRSSTHQELCLVDYGGGSGLLACLAAEMGVGRVIYIDIYDASCADVGLLSAALDLRLDHVICGDIGDLNSYVHEQSISVDAVTSYDVLEHIYDVGSHFAQLSTTRKESLRIVYVSGANIANRRYVFWVTPKQREAEYQHREKKTGHYERDTLEPLFDVRKQIISAYASNLSVTQIEDLVKSTRGLIRSNLSIIPINWCPTARLAATAVTWLALEPLGIR